MHRHSVSRFPRHLGSLALVVIAFIASLGWTSVSLAQTAEVKDFDVPAQPLESALRQVAESQRLQILYDPAQVKGVVTRGVKGRYSASQAIAKLVEGTGFVSVSNGKDAVAIKPKGEERKDGVPGGASNAGPMIAVQGDSQSAGSDSTLGIHKAEKITITGTNIPGVAPSSPVIIIDQAAIERSGYQSTGDLIRSLPQSFGGGYNFAAGASGFSTQANPSGASSPNLRGLGSESTLTLVNGRRLAYSDLVSTVDVSLIPLAAVERVEVLTDGASAIYGSDAVAGVVNFILKKDYDGVQAQATYGDSSKGDGTLQKYGVVAGKRWDAGGAVISYEHSRQDPIFASDRSFVSPDISKTTLQSKANGDSLFGSAHQYIGSSLNLFAQGLYTKRSRDSVVDSNPFLAGLVSYSKADVEQYGASAGASLDLSSDWTFSFTGDHGKNLTDGTADNLLNGSRLILLDQIFHTGLSQVELAGNGPLFRVGSRAVNLAVGASYRKETLYTKQSAGATVFGEVTADRHVDGIYGELNVPLAGFSSDRYGLESLSLLLAGRYDKYSDFGSNTIPKIGFKYTPIPSFQVKGSWGKSFRASSLLQEFLPQTANLGSSPDPSSASGSSVVLTRGGGNRGLQPEKSTAKTLNFVFTDPSLQGANLDFTLYQISYNNRVVTPVTSNSPLTDPFATPFIQRNPSVAQLANVLAVSQFVNFSGQPYDPSRVVAIIDNRYTNALSQEAKGADLLVKYRLLSAMGAVDLSFNAAYIDLKQKLTDLSPNQQLSGSVFNPPRFRVRIGGSWLKAGWTSSVFVNYVGSSSTTTTSGSESVGSWTTADMQIGYDFEKGRWLQGAKILFSVQNLFNRSGLPGIHYDSTNASAVGRFMSVQLVKSW